MMLSRFGRCLTVAVAWIALVSTAAAPGDIVSSMSDPVGDALFNNVPAFQDFVRGQLTRTANGDFHFLMEMAAPIPDAPELPPRGNSEIWWFWILNLDPDVNPAGYPWNGEAENADDNGKPPGRPPEFIVYVSWNGDAFSAHAIDRRPLITGGEAVVTPVPFGIDGKIVTATLEYDLIGEVPGSFLWGPFTFSWSGPVGSEGVTFADYSEERGHFPPEP